MLLWYLIFFSGQISTSLNQLFLLLNKSYGTSILELTNVKNVRNILNNQGFLHYANAWVHATFNSLVLGPLTCLVW